MASVHDDSKWIRVEFTNGHGFDDSDDCRIDTNEQRDRARRLLAKHGQVAARVWRGEPGYPSSYESHGTFR
jgi:hypothetical protein